jgi:hypothetical protein
MDNAASAQVVEPVPVREFLGVSAVAVAGTDELVPVRVMSFATSRFARSNDPVGHGRRQQRNPRCRRVSFSPGAANETLTMRVQTQHDLLVVAVSESRR